MLTGQEFRKSWKYFKWSFAFKNKDIIIQKSGKSNLGVVVDKDTTYIKIMENLLSDQKKTEKLL